MRVSAAVVLSLSFAALSAMANSPAKDTAKEDAPATASTSVTTPAQPKEAASPAPAAIESQLEDLRSLLQSQTQELEAQRAALRAQQLKMEALEEALRSKATSPAASAPAESVAAIAPASSRSSAVISAAASPVAAASAEPAPDPQGTAAESPLQLRIGTAYLIPIGFMDFTGVFRSRDGGSGIGTNFASTPIGVNTGIQPFQPHLSEFRFSMQNSRIGFRVDALVKGAHVIGYMESDFLGNNPGNVAVSSNSNTLRSRLYWVDVAKDKWEVLGGQTWSLITPGRTGISPLPGNLFFTQNIDVNYQLGLVWGRIPEARFVYHPTSKAAFAVALDSPEQYAGGSAGGSTIIYPAALNAGTAALAGNQINTGASTLGTPNIAPDVIAKLAFDPVSKFHLELGGVERQFKVFNANPSSLTTFTKTGGGGFVNLNFELVKGFRVLTNNFWSDGGGRYIFGQAPDLIIRNDGSISPIKSGSTVSGFEFTHGNTMLYAYYGGMYVQRNATFDTNGTTPIGYGFTGAPIANNQNRSVQEETLGFNQTLWRDGRYGALNLMGQYSYMHRNPWFIPAGVDKVAHMNMVFVNLRYTLPGSAPAIK